MRVVKVDKNAMSSRRGSFKQYLENPILYPHDLEMKMDNSDRK